MKVECEVGLFGNAAGSSKFVCNNTAVFCLVSGPADSQGSTKDSALLEVKWSESTILNNKMLERYFSRVMSSVLQDFILIELDPFKVIYIEFYISDSRRNTLFCAINAAFLALADAGIPLKGVFCATSSFSLEEEVFVYFQEKVWYIHAFGEIKDSMKEVALMNVESINEYLSFALRDKLVSSVL